MLDKLEYTACHIVQIFLLHIPHISPLFARQLPIVGLSILVKLYRIRLGKAICILHRSAYPDGQGTSSIFSHKVRKNLLLFPLDRLDFCRCHFAAENGEQDLTTLPPAFVRSILTAKPSALLRRLSVGFAVALPPRHRPLPKNRIRANA